MGDIIPFLAVFTARLENLNDPVEAFLRARKMFDMAKRIPLGDDSVANDQHFLVMDTMRQLMTRYKLEIVQAGGVVPPRPVDEAA